MDTKQTAAAKELVEASELMWAFYQDIAKTNPGFMARLGLQDYGRMNEALGRFPTAIKGAKMSLFATTKEAPKMDKATKLTKYERIALQSINDFKIKNTPMNRATEKAFKGLIAKGLVVDTGMIEGMQITEAGKDLLK